MLSDYVSSVPTIVAIVSSYIALIVAQFFKDNRSAKIALVSFAGFASIVAIITTVYSQNATLKAQEIRAKHARDLRDQIGSRIRTGVALEEASLHQDKLPPQKEVDDWCKEAANYLGQNLGPSYVARFDDPTGTPPMHPNNVDDAHLLVWASVYFRVLRLEQFSQELSFS